MQHSDGAVQHDERLDLGRYAAHAGWKGGDTAQHALDAYPVCPVCPRLSSVGVYWGYTIWYRVGHMVCV